MKVTTVLDWEDDAFFFVADSPETASAKLKREGWVQDEGHKGIIVFTKTTRKFNGGNLFDFRDKVYLEDQEVHTAPTEPRPSECDYCAGQHFSENHPDKYIRETRGGEYDSREI